MKEKVSRHTYEQWIQRRNYPDSTVNHGLLCSHTVCLVKCVVYTVVLTVYTVSQQSSDGKLMHESNEWQVIWEK